MVQLKQRPWAPARRASWLEEQQHQRRPAPPSVAGDLQEESESPLRSQPGLLPPFPTPGGVGAGGNMTIFLLQLHPVVQGPGPLGNCSQLHSGGNLLTRELGRQWGAWRCQPLYSPPGWASERDLSGK